jgi:phospholipid-transporting ATPase
MIPSVSVTGGKPTTLIPLAFVIITVLLKDAYEEYLRYKKDREENQRKTQILGSRGFETDVWENIHSGRVLKILEDELVPCDCLILASNLPDNKCFIETRSLDGETNLKVRKAPQSRVAFHKMRVEDLAQKRYEIEMEAPNESLNNVKGFINIEGETVSISIDNVLLRGCHLRNCK